MLTGLHYLLHRHERKKKLLFSKTHMCGNCLSVSAGEMFRQIIWWGSSLVAEGHQQVLRNVSALVLKRCTCNSTGAVAQARPEEWDYAKPFEDIPGPKPLPIIGNGWRFIPNICNVFWCCRQVSRMIA